MKRVLLVVIAVVATLLVVPGGAAMACSCVSATTAESVADADVVLRGTLVGTKGPVRTGVLRSSSDPVTYEFAVAEVFKGRAAATSYVQSTESPAACGLEGLVPGREYVVFARARGGQLWSGLCGGTVAGSNQVVAGVVGVTGEGEPPLAVPTAPNPSDPSGTPVDRRPGERNPAAGDTAWLVPLVGGVALALVLGTGLVLVLLRGRRRS